MRLFAGDDWAEDHHDVELMAEDGRVLARARLPEGMEGMVRLHAVSGARSDADAHVLADMVRTDAHQLRQVAGDSALA